jgi:hypothetical protein
VHREQIKGIDVKLTISDLAAILRLKPQTVRRGGAGTGEIPREYFGGEIRFDRRDVQAWLEHKRKEAHARRALLKSLKNWRGRTSFLDLQALSQERQGACERRRHRGMRMGASP